jgi:nucleoside-diphosphate-sugar epimerase
MSVLVTGGTGFVGLNVAEQLLARGEEVVVLGANPPPASALDDFAALPGKLHLIIEDVRDGAALAWVLAQHRVDRVIHAAAITAGADRDAREPDVVAEVNLLGTIRMLKAARAHGVKRFVQVGTGAVYGMAGLLDAGMLDEAVQTPVPVSMYAITKYAAERTCLRLKELWQMDLAVARLAMVYGRWEYDTGLRDRLSLLLQAVRLAEAGKEAVMPEGEFRDWIYAPDVARGLLALLDAPRLAHDVYNLGTGLPLPLTDWCAKLQERYPAFRYRLSSNPAEWTAGALAIGRSPFTAQRLREDVGFRPAYDLDKGFEDYMSWLERHPDQMAV